MIGVSFQLPIWFDLGAVFLLALTGVWAAGRRGYDVVGAFILAFVTGVGGGLLRDAIFLQEIPLVMKDTRYLWAVLAALLVGGLIRDVIVREEPVLLKPGQLFAIASLAGCVCFVLLSYKYGVDVEHAAWIAILTTLLVRMLAMRFNWTTRAFGLRPRRDDDSDTRGR